MCSACLDETENYDVWEKNDWRFDAIRDMETPIKRLAKVKSKNAKYDHKGKKPKDRISLSLVVCILLMFLPFASSHKILNPNQHNYQFGLQEWTRCVMWILAWIFSTRQHERL